MAIAKSVGVAGGAFATEKGENGLRRKRLFDKSEPLRENV